MPYLGHRPHRQPQIPVYPSPPRKGDCTVGASTQTQKLDQEIISLLSSAAVGTLLQNCLSPWHQLNKALGASINLSSNGQAERANQDLESALCCVATTHPSSRSTHLLLVQDAHNTLTCSKTGLSPFEASLEYQPFLLPRARECSSICAGVLSEDPGSSKQNDVSVRGCAAVTAQSTINIRHLV